MSLKAQRIDEINEFCEMFKIKIRRFVHLTTIFTFFKYISSKIKH